MDSMTDMSKLVSERVFKGAANRLQHVRASDQGAVVCKSRATQKSVPILAQSTALLADCANKLKCQPEEWLIMTCTPLSVVFFRWTNCAVTAALFDLNSIIIVFLVHRHFRISFVGVITLYCQIN